MKGSPLVEQLVFEEKLPKDRARQVAMLAQLAEAGRPLAAAARAVGLDHGVAAEYARRFLITFKSNGPA